MSKYVHLFGLVIHVEQAKAVFMYSYSCRSVNCMEWQGASPSNWSGSAWSHPFFTSDATPWCRGTPSESAQVLAENKSHWRTPIEIIIKLP